MSTSPAGLDSATTYREDAPDWQGTAEMGPALDVAPEDFPQADDVADKSRPL